MNETTLRLEKALMRIGELEGSPFPRVEIEIPTDDLGEWGASCFMTRTTGCDLEDAIHSLAALMEEQGGSAPARETRSKAPKRRARKKR